MTNLIKKLVYWIQWKRLFDVIRTTCWSQTSRQNLLPHGVSRSAIGLYELFVFFGPCQPWNIIAIVSQGLLQASQSHSLSSCRFSSCWSSIRPSFRIFVRTQTLSFTHLPMYLSAGIFAGGSFAARISAKRIFLWTETPPKRKYAENKYRWREFLPNRDFAEPEFSPSVFPPNRNFAEKYRWLFYSASLPT